jgi:hypothetical protein
MLSECKSFKRACIVTGRLSTNELKVAGKQITGSGGLAGFVGPTAGTIVPPETPNTVMFFDVTDVNEWFGISGTTSTTGPQDSFISSASSGLSLSTDGNTITFLPAGTYDVSLSLSMGVDQNNVNMIVALASAGSPLEVVPSLYNVSGFAITGSQEEVHNISARGTIEGPLSDVGIVAQINKAGAVAVSNINLTITSL